MTRVTALGPLPELLEQRASWRALTTAFAAEKIPLTVVENKNAFIPFEPTLSLFERSARAVGDRLFGFHVGQAMSPAEFGPWIEYAAGAKSLFHALKRTTQTSHFHQPGGRLSIEVEGDFAVWRYYPPNAAITSVQHSDHLLFPMMRFVGNFAWPGWRPDWVELNYRQDAGARKMIDLLEAPVRFEMPCVGVAFARDLLRSNKVEGKPARPLTFAEVEASYTAHSHGEPIRSVLSIVTLRLLDGRTDIDGAAEMAGLGVQTLQRLLRQNGLSYRQIVDIARSERARALLGDADKAVTDIALDLGYTDHANFTRAFNRWFGCSPSDFRDQGVNSEVVREAMASS